MPVHMISLLSWYLNMSILTISKAHSISSLSMPINLHLISQSLHKDGKLQISMLSFSSVSINSIKTNPASGDGFNLSPEIFNLLTHVALHGSEIAEKLAFNHRNRPCFKKIDSLCARMKQDLIRPDGVLPNINSQGIAWAVKDLYLYSPVSSMLG